MSKRVQLLRHLNAAAVAFVGLEGEITVNLTNDTLQRALPDRKVLLQPTQANNEPG